MNDSDAREDLLRRRVARFVRREGYPLEMGVGLDLLNCGWAVYHSAPFADPTSGEIRAADIYTSKRFLASERCAVRVALAVECKFSRGRPWVAVRGPTSSAEWARSVSTFAFADGVGRRFVSGIPGAGSVLETGRCCHALSQLPVSRSEAGDNPDEEQENKGKRGLDSAYQAQRQAIAAAYGFAKTADSRIVHGHNVEVVAVIPVVVVDGDLFEFQVELDGSDSVTRVSQVWVRASAPGDAEATQLICVAVRGEVVAVANRFSMALAQLLSGQEGRLDKFVAMETPLGWLAR